HCGRSRRYARAYSERSHLRERFHSFSKWPSRARDLAGDLSLGAPLPPAPSQHQPSPHWRMNFRKKKRTPYDARFQPKQPNVTSFPPLTSADLSLGAAARCLLPIPTTEIKTHAGSKMFNHTCKHFIFANASARTIYEGR